LLQAPEEVRVQADKARALVEAGRGALAKTRELLQPYLGDARNVRSAEAEDEQIS